MRNPNVLPARAGAAKPDVPQTGFHVPGLPSPTHTPYIKGLLNEGMMQGEATPDRTIWTVTGKDALPFLQGIVSNDVLPLGRAPGLVWAALLTPQGKYLADFFIARLQGVEGSYLIDIATPLAAATLRRLTLYRLRAEVQITPSDLFVQRGLGIVPEDALIDPRHSALGWRAYRSTEGSAPSIDWTALRVAHIIPETGIELVPEESYLLEMGFDRLHGVDFRKGCYVGQEVTARMKHKTELKKGLLRLTIEGTAPVGHEITSGEKPAGVIYSQSGGYALAWLRFDRTDDLRAGEARLSVVSDV